MLCKIFTNLIHTGRPAKVEAAFLLLGISVIGNTRDFDSRIMGSSPVSPTRFTGA